MGVPLFRPVLRDNYAPVDFDPSKFPPAAEAKKMTFGELFHSMFARAANLYDSTQHGPGFERCGMEFITESVVSFVIEAAAWIDGQVPSPPNAGALQARLDDIRRQAWAYDYGHDTGQVPSVANLIASCVLWFVPRAHILIDKATDLKMEIRRGRTTVTVVAEFEVTVEAKSADAIALMKEIACKEVFMSEDCSFKRLKSVKLPSKTTEEE